MRTSFVAATVTVSQRVGDVMPGETVLTAVMKLTAVRFSELKQYY